jgi:hypothetical protein
MLIDEEPLPSPLLMAAAAQVAESSNQLVDLLTAVLGSSLRHWIRRERSDLMADYEKAAFGKLVLERSTLELPQTIDDILFLAAARAQLPPRCVKLAVCGFCSTCVWLLTWFCFRDRLIRRCQPCVELIRCDCGTHRARVVPGPSLTPPYRQPNHLQHADVGLRPGHGDRVLVARRSQA